jgi:Protein of unknown function (DUF3040)
VPLSEHEQRLLDQIERALYQEDPKFASSVRRTDLRTHMRRRLRRAAAVLVVGFVLLIAGAVIPNLMVGLAGFVVMLGALLLALSSWKRLGSGSAPSPPLRAVGSEARSRPGRAAKAGRPARARTSGSWKDRLEERWKRRWDERDQGR